MVNQRDKVHTNSLARSLGRMHSKEANYHTHTFHVTSMGTVNLLFGVAECEVPEKQAECKLTKELDLGVDSPKVRSSPHELKLNMLPRRAFCSCPSFL